MSKKIFKKPSICLFSGGASTTIIEYLKIYDELVTNEWSYVEFIHVLYNDSEDEKIPEPDRQFMYDLANILTFIPKKIDMEDNLKNLYVEIIDKEAFILHLSGLFEMPEETVKNWLENHTSISKIEFLEQAIDIAQKTLLEQNKNQN